MAGAPAAYHGVSFCIFWHGSAGSAVQLCFQGNWKYASETAHWGTFPAGHFAVQHFTEGSRLNDELRGEAMKQLLTIVLFFAAAVHASERDQARQLVETSAIKGGLVVHL